MESGINQDCQWKVAKLDRALANFVSLHKDYHHNNRLYTFMADQVTNLSVPGLHTGPRVDTWHAACSWAASTPGQDNNPLRRKSEFLLRSIQK